MIGIIFPVLSLAIIEKGLDYFQLGILMAVYSGVTVLLELPTGGLADSIGRKRGGQ
jgi:DHA1 family quinolone resistance protein-like MFS transporter